MSDSRYLDELICQKVFRFDRLDISGIDNEVVARIFSSSMLEQEICLTANTVHSGDEYCRILSERISSAMQKRRPLPVVRFADGEYAFYRYTLGCNGLYKQAESEKAIRQSMPQHIAALQYAGSNGLLAPLVFPGNANVAARRLFPFFRKEEDSSGADFLDFLKAHDIVLTPENYIPFYVVYAYFSSPQFSALMDGKNVCILNSDYNSESCRNWFAQSESRPQLDFVDIPKEYVATRWEEIKTPILNRIPPRTQLCLVGAGVGALFICAEVARKFSIPAIDAGHVLNMMNDRVDKSNGARLYTLRKN